MFAMRELKCPKCGSVFTVDEADYASIVSQVKNAEFDAEVKQRVEEIKRHQESMAKMGMAMAEEQHQDMKVSEGSFHAMLASLFSLTTYNAMYAPIFNSINLFPPFLMDPIYGPDASTAERYAAMTVFGHEITHGFDKKGAQWDKQGDKNSIWASEADAVEFDRRAQQLVDYYNTFEVAPGVFADGQKTLNENIADLGGVQLAFQALTNKLKADGLSNEAIRQQQRNFFVAYANLWRMKYTDEYAESMVASDEHSQSKERINGVVTNIDAWYDLFDVKPTDKMYLAPEKRIRIW